MEPKWIVEANGKQFGPFTTEQLVELAQSGKVQPNQLVRKDGGPFVACAELKFLFSGLKTPVATPGRAAGSDAVTGNRARPREEVGPQGTTLSGTGLTPPAPNTRSSAVEPSPPRQPMGDGSRDIPPRPETPAAQAAPVVVTRGRMQLPASTQLLCTGVALLVGAAAAVVIYINLGPLQKRILDSGRRGDEEPIASAPATMAEQAVAAPSTLAPPPAVELPAGSGDSRPAGGIVNDGPTEDSGRLAQNSDKPAVTGNGIPAGGAPPAPANGELPAPRRSIVESSKSIVLLRTASGTIRTVVASGFIIDAEGTIATSFSALSALRAGTSYQALFHDGSSAEILGYLVAAKGQDIVLLRVSKPDAVAVPFAQNEIEAGTAVFAAGAGSGGVVSFTPSMIDRAIQLTKPMNASNGAPYLDAGVRAGTLRDRIPTTSRGGAVVNEQGELLGLLGATASGEQYVIDRKHVRDLAAGAGMDVRRLEELTGPPDAALAGGPAGGPANQPGGFPVGRPVAGEARFINGPAVRIIVNGGQVVPQRPALIGTPGSWINVLDSIYARRGTLIATRDEIQSTLKPLLAEANRLDGEYRSLDRQARAVRAQYARVENQMAALNRRRLIESNVSAIDSDLYDCRRELSRLRYNFEELEEDAGELRTAFNLMKPRIDVQNGRMATLVKDANLLRNEFLKHLDPFGTPSKERGEEGVRYFTGKIGNERESSFAYFGRGCSYLSQAEAKAALADLDAAVKAAPQEAIFLTVRGVAHSRAGDAAKARKDLADAIRFDDKNYWCRFQYALVLCRTEGFAIIEQQLKECMKLDPQSPDAFTMMAMLKSTGDDKIRHADYALRMAQTAYDMSVTKSWDTAMAMAAAHAEKGDFEMAVQYAEKSVAAASERQAAWCREGLKTFQEKKPLRIDWKTFDFLALL